jgi:acyl-coenzyme A thioesterase PaaI-like protein
MRWFAGLMSPAARETLALRLFSLTRIPMLAFIRPAVADITPERIVVEIRLSRRTRNHLGSMYFAALCAGADCAAGGLAMHFIRREKAHISMVFKDFQASFERRADGDVHFICEQGRDIAQLVRLAAESAERVERQFEVLAIAPTQGGERVATFKLTLSLKRRDQVTRLRASPR